MGKRGAQARTEYEWQAIAEAALLDLLADRLVVPWAEVVARISQQGWKDFPKAQPLQLSGARQRLRKDGRIEEESTKHTIPVATLRLPYPEGRKRELERLAGERRKKFRVYLSLASDQAI